MKLYKVPNKSWIILKGEKYFFDHIDGMYSYCTDEDGNVVHLAAFTDVELCQENQ